MSEERIKDSSEAMNAMRVLFQKYAEYVGMPEEKRNAFIEDYCAVVDKQLEAKAAFDALMKKYEINVMELGNFITANVANSKSS